MTTPGRLQVNRQINDLGVTGQLEVVTAMPEHQVKNRGVESLYQRRVVGTWHRG